uniref:uncharacterized protein LOC122605335 n=1 Tax=Erigeron canadensis TaxID=72917 RepID=UPI001CB8CE0D|nr:uncharacterized protein LOC122605335 [Erigeron canadensis]XP_043634198.1 uncharacterized protein LOC122605335 [Erigeron canadensis]
MDEDDDGKREAAISSVIAAASLKSKLSNGPSSSSVTQSRISKFQELHNRRIQIKEKSKIKKKKSKGRSSGPIRLQENAEERASECKTDQGTSTSISLDEKRDDVLTKNVAPPIVSKRPQKLYWGLDTKERWERKSNM